MESVSENLETHDCRVCIAVGIRGVFGASRAVSGRVYNLCSCNCLSKIDGKSLNAIAVVIYVILKGIVITSLLSLPILIKNHRNIFTHFPVTALCYNTVKLVNQAESIH